MTTKSDKMDKNNMSCDICGSNNTRTDNAEWAPFISERIWGKKQINNKLVLCNDCGYAFAIPRPTDEELNRLYCGYRGKEYQEQRQKYEPYYTIQANMMSGGSHEFRKNRIETILLLNHTNIGCIHTVLDYGGDIGDLFPDVFAHCEKYVYDVSDAPLLYGVKKVNGLLQSDALKFDYIQCCHTLEHCSNPKEIINNILKFTRSGTLIYIELPYDPSINSFKVNFFLTHPYINKIFASIIGRPENRYRIIHEHINIFTKKSLTILLENNNLTIQNIQIIDDAICCIASVI